jgi:glyoxylase I family protein
MERVTGIGGMFFRARDPDALARWYAEHLGIDNQLEGGDTIWWQERGPTVFAPFPADTDYLGRPEQAWMLNFRVRDLDAIGPAGCTTRGATGWLSGSGRLGDQTPETHRTPWPVPTQGSSKSARMLHGH